MRKIQSLLFLSCLAISALCFGGETKAITQNKPSTKTEQANHSPNVVVSLPPFQALVSAVMEGVGKPKLLVKPGASPHHYALAPSEVQTLEKADIVFWGGPELESFLVNHLKNAKPNTQVIELDQTPGLFWLNSRTAALWSEEEDKETDEHAEHSHDDTDSHSHVHGEKDMHFWLDPNNAALMVDYIAEKLSDLDPKNKALFKSNASRFKKELAATDQQIKKQLSAVKKAPFFVFHDAYHYYEHYYGLNSLGSITQHPELPISINRMKKIREAIEKEHVVCVFSEPQFKSNLTENLAKDFNLHTGVLDPLGQPDKNGNYSYITLLENITHSLINCLSQGKVQRNN